jgi:acetyl-CoA carboxylase carboxyl transferase subunit alpha
MRLTAEDLRRLRLIDEVVPEPVGGAHRDPGTAIQAVGDAVGAALNELVGMDGATLKARRRERFLEMGRETFV